MDKKTLTALLEENGRSGPVAFHMPGHKRRVFHSPSLPWQLDITEVEGFDDLHDPSGILLEGMERAAALWGSERSWFLINGSSGGILAALHAALPRGCSLLVARNCHKSIYHALELLDLHPVFLQPPVDAAFGIAGSISVQTVSDTLDTHPDVRALMLPCPTYDGVLSDLPGLCKLCHSRGVAVIVDAAHGAHLGFSPFPAGAVEAGADVVIHSVHKTLPSLTQTALLHWQGELISPRRLARSLGIFQSSSPSYPLMASIDGCVRLLEEKKTALFSSWSEALAVFDDMILPLKHLNVLCRKGDTPENHPDFWGYDPSKIVISTRGTDLTGPALMRRLNRDFGLELEMASTDYVTAMTGAGTTQEDLTALAQALLVIDAELTSQASSLSPAAPALPRRVLSAAQALEQPCEIISIAQAVGRIAGEYLWAYPPGIPLLVPGEEIGEDFPALSEGYAASGISLKHTGGTEEGMILVCR